MARPGQGKNKLARSLCCGAQLGDADHVLCCLVDPRAPRDLGLSGGGSHREQGEWCRWCGDDVKLKGRSFCSRACGISYAEDIGMSVSGAVFQASVVMS